MAQCIHSLKNTLTNWQQNHPIRFKVGQVTAAIALAAIAAASLYLLISKGSHLSNVEHISLDTSTGVSLVSIIALVNLGRPPFPAPPSEKAFLEKHYKRAKYMAEELIELYKIANPDGGPFDIDFYDNSIQPVAKQPFSLTQLQQFKLIMGIFITSQANNQLQFKSKNNQLETTLNRLVPFMKQPKHQEYLEELAKTHLDYQKDLKVVTNHEKTQEYIRKNHPNLFQEEKCHVIATNPYTVENWELTDKMLDYREFAELTKDEQVTYVQERTENPEKTQASEGDINGYNRGTTERNTRALRAIGYALGLMNWEKARSCPENEGGGGGGGGGG
ncbi:MAG: hypothetical protein SP1CHLAM54_15650 [Chlamydiia bacterium]|nr:hypothetical protein [Chlamydiia bacterium]MCH9616455.1 hypothetical protein [Chlamydiia bacterium]MCH9629559.1 hypothetical protein [Chlamydiia bacterium]